jgi:hypothetical protein
MCLQQASTPLVSMAVEKRVVWLPQAFYGGTKSYYNAK